MSWEDCEKGSVGWGVLALRFGSLRRCWLFRCLEVLEGRFVAMSRVAYMVLDPLVRHRRSLGLYLRSPAPWARLGVKRTTSVT